jgi:hypothetical protein
VHAIERDRGACVRLDVRVADTPPTNVIGADGVPERVIVTGW